jgi:ferredoxin
MTALPRPPAWSRPGPTALVAPAASVAPAATDDVEAVLVIDRIACDGYGTCAELLPEIIDLDEWGYPIMRSGPIPPKLLDHAQRAVDACPVLALRIATRPRATMAANPGAPGPTPGNGRRANGGSGG